MNSKSLTSVEGEPVVEYSEEVLRNLTPEERDELVLPEEHVIGSSYLRSKRRRLRRRGKPLRRTMWEPMKDK